jgi:cellulose synthase/poly-beta-1,6-N-acetylglucosamine synthase-like glycosyltransferase
MRTPADIGDFASCARRLYLPLVDDDGRCSVTTADVGAENLAWLRATYPGARIAGNGRRQLFEQFESECGAQIAEDAVHALARSSPSLSARTVLTSAQAALFGFLAILMASAFAAWRQDAFRDFAFLTSAAFLAGTVFRGVLAFVGAGVTNDSIDQIDHDDTLPLYTILVPLYREANVLARLVEALLALDYPADRLDIKLIVESDDHETAEVAASLSRDLFFHLVRVPQGAPRTKPRACNYAFAFARGKFTVIYDAEDRPEPDQLRKAVTKFRRISRDVACLQAHLNFYNVNENWLTRLFALDYALWFDVLLPGLERIRLPIPLGGTSNHFRTSALQSAGAWDPFNVTEDADLGIRLARMGMRVAMLDSTTFEEAPTTFNIWLRQRSRWLKGYMQTWLVHMRDPGALRRDIGWRGFFSLQFFLGGSVISALVNPLLWLVFLVSGGFVVPAADDVSTLICLLSLLGGNVILTWLAVIAPRRRGWSEIAPYGFTASFYWALISIAAWRAFWQLVTQPFYWEKTEHGLSRLDQPPR